MMSPQEDVYVRKKTKSTRLAKLGLAAWIAIIWLLWPNTAQAFEPWWIQNHMETELWSGKTEGAASFGKVKQWNYFKVVAPQGNDTRLYIWNPITENYAYIDAIAVGPSGPPPSQPVVTQTSPTETQPTQASSEQEDEFEPWIGETQVATELWSGIDAAAISFGWIPKGTELKIISEQKENRYHVINIVTNNYAYIDANAVVKKGEKPTDNATITKKPNEGALRNIPALANGYEGWWVSNFIETELWPNATTNDPESSLGSIPQFRRFLVVEPQNGDRLRVWYPEKDIFGYLDAKVVGPSSESIWLEGDRIVEEREMDSLGRSIGEKTFVRTLPVYDDETELRRLPNNTEISVKKLIITDDGKEWCMIGEGEYVLASEVRLPRPPERYYQGRWIDADLDEPTLLTAYEGDRVVKTALAIKGVAKYPTPVGYFTIIRRVANETMDSETLGIPRDAPGGYYLKNVLYTQYFTNDGASLHYNYWRGTFGYPGSHGCLGLSLEDSIWFWEWSDVGTPLVVRSSGVGQMVQTGAGTASTTEGEEEGSG